MILRNASLFAQCLELIPRDHFQALVRKHGAESHSKGFSSWDQCVGMLFCQLAGAHSLREISYGLASCMGKLVHLGLQEAPARSTLSYANEHRPWQLYQDLFAAVLEQARPFAKGKGKLRFRNPLYSLDSTTIDLCLEMFEWAKFRRTKGAVKLHLVLDHEGYLPTFAHITDGKTHELNAARMLSLPPGSMVAMDRAYNDYSLFAEWCDKDIGFVTRMKDHAVYEVLESNPDALKGAVRADELIVLTGVWTQGKCAHILRRVVVWDEDKQREIVLLTNLVEFAASTVARIYKERWQIELFFKALKQNLRVKSFVGTSANALKTQLWTALIAMLILKVMQLRATFGWSLSNLVAMLRMNLFTYRDLWDWLNAPFETPLREPGAEQRQFDFGTT
jgi:DDE family transposase/uncharacterized protein DUF4372